jgi:hypothetical protein
MRDGVAVHVVRPCAIAVEPVAHQLGVEAASILRTKPSRMSSRTSSCT